MHANRRLYPRLNTDLSGDLRCRGQYCPVRVVNLSLGGLLIEGDLASLTLPDSQGTRELELCFNIGSLCIDVRCRLVYTRRLSCKRIALGLHMLTLSPQGRDEIDAYVSKQLGL